MGELGLVVRSPAGFPAENPYLGVIKRAMVEMHRWGRELGIVTKTARRKEKSAAAPGARDEEQPDAASLDAQIAALRLAEDLAPLPRRRAGR